MGGVQRQSEGSGEKNFCSRWKSKHDFSAVPHFSCAYSYIMHVHMKIRSNFVKVKKLFLACPSFLRGRERLSACRAFQLWNKVTEFGETC